MFTTEISRWSSLLEVLCDKHNFIFHDLHVLERTLKSMPFLSKEVLKYFKTIQLKLCVQEVKSVVFKIFKFFANLFEPDTQNPKWLHCFHFITAGQLFKLKLL